MAFASRKIFLSLLVYRLIFALLTRNYEHPDEHYQANQVAHYIHYGYGFRTWEWTIKQPIRNPIYPFILSLSYYILDFFQIQGLHYLAPKFLIQVPISIICDFFLLKILYFFFKNISYLVLISIFTNWYYGSTLTRTYSNSFEASLTIVAYYFWVTNGQLGNNNKRQLISRLIVAVTYLLRPTSLVPWSFFWPYELYEIIKCNGFFSKKSIQFFFKNIGYIVILVVVSLILGSGYYGKVVLTQANFLKYNIKHKLAELFGKQPFYYYFVIVLPFTINFGLVLVLLALTHLFFSPNNSEQAQQQQQKEKKKKKKLLKVLFWFCLYFVGFYSYLNHKQPRYILTVVPFMLILGAYCLSETQIHFWKFKIPAMFLKKLLCLIVITNVFLLLSFNLYGKSSGVSTWKFIEERMQQRNLEQNDTSVVVMGSAYFFEGASVLHKNISFKIPNASPFKMKLNLSEDKYLTENPEKLFKILTKDDKHPEFIIAQGRFIFYTEPVILKHGFVLSKRWRHFTLAQQLISSYDYIYLYQPKDQIKMLK